MARARPSQRHHQRRVTYCQMRVLIRAAGESEPPKSHWLLHCTPQPCSFALKNSEVRQQRAGNAKEARGSDPANCAAPVFADGITQCACLVDARVDLSKSITVLAGVCPSNAYCHQQHGGWRQVDHGSNSCTEHGHFRVMRRGSSTLEHLLRRSKARTSIRCSRSAIVVDMRPVSNR